jgi:hypothetical protein
MMMKRNNILNNRNKMQTLVGHLALLMLLFVMVASCYREPLELYYDGKADAMITYDWMSKYGYRPDGMTLMLAHNGDQIGTYDVTHNIDQTNLRTNSGTYLLTVMNKTFGEYSTVSFYNRNSHNDIHVKSKTYYVQSEHIWDNGRTYLEQPEKIGVGIDTFKVSNVIDSLIFYDYRDEASPDTIHLKRHVVIEPMTTTLRVRVKVRGISYMRAMEGYITGMADGFYLNQRWRTKEVGTIKLEGWERDTEYESAARRRGEGDEETNVGWMLCNVETFGLPHGRELLKDRVPESNYIMLHFTLIDGRTVDFAYQVGKNIRYAGDDGTLTYFYQADVSLELDLVIDAPFYENEEVPTMPYAQPEGTGQFDAEVEPWGDDENVDVPM